MASFKKLDSGSWEVSFYYKTFSGENKKKKKSGFRTKKEASDFANDFIAKMSGSCDIKLSTLIDEFIEYKSDKVKLNTLRTYHTRRYNLKNTDIYDIPLNKLDKRLIFKTLNNIPSNAHVKVFLKMVFDYAKINYNYSNSDILNFKLEKTKDKETITEKSIWTLEEFKTFDELLKKEKKLHNRVFFNLLYYSGARANELTGLTLEDINLELGTININKTRLEGTNKISINRLSYNSPKTQSSKRSISLPVETCNLLKSYINTIPNLKNTFIFKSGRCYINKLKQMCVKYEMKFITLHGFRHSHASLLIKNGIPLTDIAKRLGHANPNITLSTYSHFYDNKKDAVIDFLNNL